MCDIMYSVNAFADHPSVYGRKLLNKQEIVGGLKNDRKGKNVSGDVVRSI